MFSKQMALIVCLILLITLSILIVSLNSRQTYPTFGPGRVAIALVAPFQKLIVHTTHFFSEIWEHYFSLIAVVDDNARMREELQQSAAIRHKYEEAMQANERLRRLLALGQEMQRPVIAAQVIGKDPSPWFQTILIDKGAKDGVNIGMPVVAPQGVVGLVVESIGHYAKVMLITDPNSAVDAVVQASRARGIIKGGTSGFCVLNFIMHKHEIQVGDAVISSGMDGVFPKGFPIGSVTEVNKDSGVFQEITVTPFVDFERLEEVVIVPQPEPPEFK